MIDRYITATAGGRDAALGGAMNVDIAMAERSVVIRGRTAEKLAIPQKYPNRKQRQSPEEWLNMLGETTHNAVKL
jgi:hypothetical protein